MDDSTPHAWVVEPHDAIERVRLGRGANPASTMMGAIALEPSRHALAGRGVAAMPVSPVLRYSVLQLRKR